MIITKEQQEELLRVYWKDDNNMDKCDGFVDGIEATIELVGRILEAEKELKN